MSDFIYQESSRCLRCKNPRCKQGCPIGYDIPEFLDCAKKGELGKAVKTVGHPFGEVCGYICPRDKQCKGHCVLGAKGAAVDVGAVEGRCLKGLFAICFKRTRRLLT